MSIVSSIKSTLYQTVIADPVSFWTGKKPENVTVADAVGTYIAAAAWPLVLPLTMIGCEPIPTGKEKGDLPEDAGNMDQTGTDSDTIIDQDSDTTNGTQTDAGTILDDGVLPDAVFEEIEGQGTAFFHEVKLYPFSYEFEIPGIHSVPLHVDLGVDPTQFEEMPAAGCYNNLVDFNQASESDIANGYNCPEEGYENFAVCPSDDSKRLPLYLGDYTVTVYRFVGGEYEEIGTDSGTLSTIDALYTDPDSCTLIPEACGDEPSPLQINISPEHTNQLDESGDNGKISIQLNLIVDGRQADANGTYKTKLMLKVDD